MVAGFIFDEVHYPRYPYRISRPGSEGVNGNEHHLRKLQQQFALLETFYGPQLLQDDLKLLHRINLLLVEAQNAKRLRLGGREWYLANVIQIGLYRLLEYDVVFNVPTECDRNMQTVRVVYDHDPEAAEHVHDRVQVYLVV